MKFVCQRCTKGLDIADKQIQDAYQENFGANQALNFPKRIQNKTTNLSIGFLAAIKYHLRLNGWTIRVYPQFHTYTEKIVSFAGEIVCSACATSGFDPENFKHL